MKKAKQYIQKRQASISTFLKTAPKKYDDATFHGLRVEIKKVKALIDVLEIAFPKFKARKMYQPFRKCFKSAGRVRERQLEASILNNAVGDDFPKTYQRKLTNQIRKEKASFFNLTTPGLRKKMKKQFRTLRDLLHKLDPSTLKSILDQKKVSILKWSQQEVFSDWDLHQIRKELKSLRYVQTALEVEKPFLISSSAKGDFTDLLGEWHDLVVVKDHLKKFSQKGKRGKKEMERMQRSEAKLDKVIKEMQGQIVNEIPAIGN